MNIASRNRYPLPVIIISGPTAVGKSHTVYKILGTKCEIINADSRQIYKYLNIGTAKPSQSELKRIPHHLINEINPKDQFNAGMFVRSANRIVCDIYSRGRIPFVIGGTAFYIKSFLYGLPEAPPSDHRIRVQLKKTAEKKGLAYLFNKLSEVDPIYANKIKKNDKLRIIRALEVYKISGKPVSSYYVPDKIRKDFIFHLIGLNLDRETLYRRINERVETMFAIGLIDEIKLLIKKGFLQNDPGMKGIGYREFFQMQYTCFLLKDIKDLIKQNTRNLAKRQLTFLKSLKTVRWFKPDDVDGIKIDIINFLKKKLPKEYSFDGLFRV